jgi:hypothetical protein
VRSRDPNLIVPGEKIRIQDIGARLMFVHSLELTDKSFTKPQLETMRAWIDAGRTMFDP